MSSWRKALASISSYVTYVIKKHRGTDTGARVDNRVVTVDGQRDESNHRSNNQVKSSSVVIKVGKNEPMGNPNETRFLTVSLKEIWAETGPRARAPHIRLALRI